ncbi:MAG: DeoR/GlpR transcriptional regulator [Clostridia bacterium]|nr:DeoR/GlpR transcriptional regulator [Clostridia bacterium]
MEYKDRKKDILDILYANGRVSVSKLAKTLFVSEMTIRRDLSEMEKDGVLDFGGLFVFLGVTPFFHLCTFFNFWT